MSSELLLQSIQGQLRYLGYASNLIRRNYEYADVSGQDYRTREIPLAAFAQDPPSYRNACIGVTFSNGAVGEPNVARHVALGAPLIFEIQPGGIYCWTFTGDGAPKFMERIAPAELPNVFSRHRSAWRPRDIFEAKTGLLPPAPAQLDFIDVGLLPALEGMVQEKLDRLLRETLADVVATHNRVSTQPIDIRDLYKLLFRFIAAKVLRDREHPGDWHSNDARTVLNAIQAYYSAGSPSLDFLTIDRQATLDVGWKAISSKFYFQNLSVDDLAFIYENTFVTQETRQAFGTHSTPPHVAEYILRNLPVEAVDQDRRRVFEPYCGHGIFLVSAMRRLKELLPSDVGHLERHGYLRERLVGVDIDSFALEVGRLNLMLADYPNPDGWRLNQDDVILSERLPTELARADIVVCNPPFGTFSVEERRRYAHRLRRLQKPAHILLEVLEQRPELLGFVLPKEVFTHGREYQEAHRLLAEAYSEIALVALPDRVFNFSDEETVLLIASRRRSRNDGVHVSCRVVSDELYPAFKKGLAEPPAVTDVVPLETVRANTFTLWLPRLPALWRRLADRPTLGSIAVVYRAIQAGRGHRLQEFASAVPIEGWSAAYITTRQNLAQYHIEQTGSIKRDQSLMEGRPLERDWASPKVLANAVASSRGPWRLSGVVDYTGALATQAFQTLTPRQGTSVEFIAAILNGPVANAWLFVNEGKKHNKRATIATIPIPRPEIMDEDGFISRVQKLEELLRGDGSEASVVAQRANALILEIDALLLRAYELTDELEYDLLKLFEHHERPTCFPFIGYGPDFEQAKQRIVAEEEQQRRIDRYQSLVEQEFDSGLSSDEAEEMERLGEEIDRYFDPFYQPIIERLEAELKRRRARR